MATQSDPTPKAAPLSGTVVYIGPSTGPLRQYQVFIGGQPKFLTDLIASNPMVRSLVVPVETFADVHHSLNHNPSSEHAVVFSQVKASLAPKKEAK